ncbi:Ubiquitin_fold modifier 1 protein [Hexamita inflata]|uniref:Ubiquitin-fold modifier 1 n=1 Tax=Hexamita inflata TaxID=28002 RepID=A0AA86TSF4_9EUKA|nr:Ubiquitin fold modifier 1 protein [Hexamita inflata]CAI9933957.1 Ubiquitin fold modifier 1 protein [Hexamita inflata]
MQLQQEIPVSEELKQSYIKSLDLIDFTITRAFDPVRQYKIISVPTTMKYEVFIKTVSKDFSIDEMNVILLDMSGDQIISCQTVNDLQRRYGEEFQISAYQHAVQYVRE